MSMDTAPLNNNDDVHLPKTTTGSAPNSLPGSPRNRVKFMCSHGGKILPRPADGQLKYVGGETRVISVPKDIPFQELMKKLTVMIEGDMILKYQIVTEDLDSLISVKSDEDVRHMFDEIERYENAGIPRLRVFLFPKNPVVSENQTASDAHAAEQQRYIDAINGILRCHAPPGQRQHSSVTPNRSTPSSPKSSCAAEAVINHGLLSAAANHSDGANNDQRSNMHRVLSSPSIYGLGNNLLPAPPHQHLQPNASQHHLQLVHPHQYHHYVGGFQSPQPDRLTSARSVGRAEGVRYQADPASQYYYSVSKRSGSNGCCGKHCTGGGGVAYQEETMGQGGYNSDWRKINVERTGSFTISPVPSNRSSPRFGHSGARAWDETITETFDRS